MKFSSVLAFLATEKCVFVLSRVCLLYCVLRLRQLVVLELSSFLTFRAHFESEYLGEPCPSQIILLVDELVLVEIQYIRVERPVTPIFERKIVAEAH